MEQLKIAVAWTGYVGLSIATLLAQHHNVMAVDIVPEKVELINNRNLLGGLYRENPVKSRNYEAVKSSKKWENVGNSYIIPALLLYRYSYI